MTGHGTAATFAAASVGPTPLPKGCSSKMFVRIAWALCLLSTPSMRNIALLEWGSALGSSAAVANAWRCSISSESSELWVGPASLFYIQPRELIKVRG